MQVFETPGSVSLRINLPSGRVVVTTTDEPQTSVELVPVGRRGPDAIDEIEVTMDEHRGRHVVRIEQKNKFRWGPIQITWGGDFEVRVTCPHGADLDFSGGSTDVRSHGELGEAAVRTASGDVKLESVRGTIEAKTASGDIAVETIVAEASLVTVSGDLEVGRVNGPLAARSVSGDVDLDSIGIEAREVRVQTVSGDVRVGVGQGTRVWIDAASVSGELGSELGLEDEGPASDTSGPVVPLHVKTVSGDVAIVRAAGAFSA